MVASYHVSAGIRTQLPGKKQLVHLTTESSKDREKLHACMPGAQLAFLTLIQSRTPNQGAVPPTFRLGLSASIT